MPGQQLKHTQNRGEYLALSLLSSLASVTQVRKEEDYGSDLLCTPVYQEAAVLRPGRPFGLQVKPATKRNVAYGGLDKHGQWKNYEISWLFNQEQPFILAVTDTKNSHIKLYSTTRKWYLGYQIGTTNIGRLVLSPDKLLPAHLRTESNQWRYKETRLDLPKAKTIAGNGFSYTVPLGKPIIELYAKAHSEDQLRTLAETLRIWIDIEYVNITYHRMGIPYVVECVTWETNEPPSQFDNYQFWNTAPGKNIPSILASITPAIQSLLLHLEAQGALDQAKFVIPLAQWLRTINALDGIGLEVLERLESRIA